jgi:hypothetical protein
LGSGEELKELQERQGQQEPVKSLEPVELPDGPAPQEPLGSLVLQESLVLQDPLELWEEPFEPERRVA